jgi:hypothetical protein
VRRIVGVIALTAALGLVTGCGESKVVSTNGSFSGGQGGAPSADFRQRFEKFRSCLASHGVKLPAPQPGESGPPGGMRRSLNPSDPTTQKALQACRSSLPFRSGGGPPGGYPGGSGGGPPGGYPGGSGGGPPGAGYPGPAQ